MADDPRYAVELGPLFSQPAASAPKPLDWRAHDEARGDLERCVRGQGATILEFLRQRVGREFHADELRVHVAKHHETAPGSSDRVLRDLRQRGYCKVVCVSRAESRYHVQEVKTDAEEG